MKSNDQTKLTILNFCRSNPEPGPNGALQTGAGTDVHIAKQEVEDEGPEQ